MSTITFIGIYFGLSLVFMISVFTFLRRIRKKENSSFENDWIRFQESVKKEDINNLNIFGTKVIWNQQKAELEHRKTVLHEVSKRKENYPVLTKLWKDSFYLVYGLEPLNDDV